jgi:hypothetical protein
MFRMIRDSRSVFIGMTILAFLIAIPIEHALAALIDTQAFETEPHSDHFRTQMKNLLAREDVRVALLRHGINPAEVEERIAAMTDKELSQTSESKGLLPAGAAGDIVVFPLAVVIFILVVLVLVITGAISFGAYAGVKIQEHQEEAYAKSTPFPAPPRVGPLPGVNPNEPWTGKWKVTEGKFRGVYCLQQNGDRVVSTSDSDQVVDAKVYGAMIWGKLGKRQDFKATIASDFISFKGNVESGYSVEGQKIEYVELKPEPTALKVNPSEPWTGKWKVSNGRNPGIWSLTQNGDTVISTSGSDFKLEAKVYGAMIRGKWSTKGGTDRDFQATMAEGGLSFNGAADYTALRDYFTAKKIE